MLPFRVGVFYILFHEIAICPFQRHLALHLLAGHVLWLLLPIVDLTARPLNEGEIEISKSQNCLDFIIAILVNFVDSLLALSNCFFKQLTGGPRGPLTIYQENIQFFDF